jgi:hypothetical protein
MSFSITVYAAVSFRFCNYTTLVDTYSSFLVVKAANILQRYIYIYNVGVTQNVTLVSQFEV